MIVCRSAAEIEKLARVNALVARVLKELATAVRPGITTADLDALAEQRLREAGAEPAFKGYHGYPATICASVNEEVVHGIPSPRALVEGDIISIDMGAKLDGFYGDSAVTVPVGAVSAEAQRLLDVTRTALDRAVATVKAGARVSDIGAAVRRTSRRRGFRWSASSWAMASERRSTRSRRFRTTGPPDAVRGWHKAWRSRSSPW